MTFIIQCGLIATALYLMGVWLRPAPEIIEHCHHEKTEKLGYDPLAHND